MTVHYFDYFVIILVDAAWANDKNVADPMVGIIFYSNYTSDGKTSSKPVSN